MAIRKALVLVSGEIQQLQAGDTLAGTGTEVGVITLTNSDAAATVIGDAMYIFANDGLKKAKADALGTCDVAFFATAAIGAAATGSFQSDGVLSGLSGLIAGSTYYLSATTAGAMSTTAPSTVGQYVVRLGKALSATEFEINVRPPILL